MVVAPSDISCRCNLQFHSVDMHSRILTLVMPQRYRHTHNFLNVCSGSITQEILPSMKLVKYYGWESFFERKIMGIRKKENALAAYNNVLKTINIGLVFSIPPTCAFAIFASYEFNEERVSSTLAFTTLTLFNIMRFPLVVLPKALRAASGASLLPFRRSCVAIEMTLCCALLHSTPQLRTQFHILCWQRLHETMALCFYPNR